MADTLQDHQGHDVKRHSVGWSGCTDCRRWIDTRPTPAIAASWVVNMQDGPERSRLWNGHRMRRVETMRDGYRATDHTAADAWLIEEYRKAHMDN